MTLAAGTRLGPYEVVSPLGAGGMGEVWRAKDTRLEREVAIKILPADFAANVQFKARFEREAKTISQLNHPNVCTLFDVGEAVIPTSGARRDLLTADSSPASRDRNDGSAATGGTTINFLVMELIEGESLADRLLKGALPIELVLRHGAEIASALDAAHRQGIVHRDLKPGNVMLTKSGAKLLDFGLAKSGPLLSSTSSVSQLADNPTEHRPLTEQGTILGTFQYMAPEQLEGQEADARTDIFAFGAVLYEMATGRRAFQGKNKTSLIAAIVSSSPTPVSQIAPLTPPALDHVIRKCLAKDADDRWQSIRDVADQLAWIGEAGSRAGEPAPVLAKRKTKLRVAWALHAATALVAVAVTAGVIYATRPKPVIIRSSLLAPDKTKFDAESGAMALSPDGTRIAFLAYGEDKRRMLWVRPLSALSAQPLAGTEDASFPFWSPDSRFIGFFSNGKLRKIDANGGPPQALCDASQGRGGCWTEGGTILFAPSPTDPLFKVSSAGGTPAKVTELDAKKGETSHRHPSILPDGVHFIFLVEAHPPSGGGGGEGFSIAIGSLETKQYRQLLESKSSARYSKSGYILFLRDRTLLAQRFDAKKLELVGEPQPVAENMTRTNRWETTFSLSDTGLLAFQAGSANEASQLEWVDRDGKDLGAVGKPADLRSIALSHDGTRVAVAIMDPKTQTQDIWVLDVERGTSTRLTFDPEDDGFPVWSMDDRYVYFFSRRQGSGDVFRKASDGTGTDEFVFGDSNQNILTSVTADGGTAGILSNAVGKTGWDISLLNLADGKSRVFLATPFSEVFPMLSRDGRWLAYHSNESGRNEIYVQSLQAGGGKWQISTDGGTRPRWVRDDRELVWQSPDDTLMVVDVQFEPKFAPSVPRQLLDPRIRSLVAYEFDLSRDGNRILVNRSIEQPVVVPVTLVQNWTQALEK